MLPGYKYIVLEHSIREVNYSKYKAIFNPNVYLIS